MDQMRNNKKAQKTTMNSTPPRVLMINVANLSIKPGEARLMVQEQIADSSAFTTKTLPMRIVYKPLKATTKLNTATLLIEPENPELETECLPQDVTNNNTLAEQCRKALEKSYGCTVPIPTGFLRKRFVMNRNQNPKTRSHCFGSSSAPIQQFRMISKSPSLRRRFTISLADSLQQAIPFSI